LAVQTRVEVDKRQILTLLGREVFCRVTHAGHPIQLFVRASHEEEAWMNVRYRVELSQTERSELTSLLSGGKQAVRKLKRAQILLAADAGVSDDDIATSVGVGGSTVYRTKQRFVFGNLEAALSEAPRPGASRKLSSKEEALLVATACSKPPLPSASAKSKSHNHCAATSWIVKKAQRHPTSHEVIFSTVISICRRRGFAHNAIRGLWIAEIDEPAGQKATKDAVARSRLLEGSSA